jgi:plastocyanin
MDQHSNEHSGHGEHAEVHLPDPSIWPLIVGASALLLGFALVFWTRDRHNGVAGPVLGAAVLAVLVAAAGWAYEDGRMRKKAQSMAEAGAGHGPRDARFTQVLTFGVPEGRLAAARGTGLLDAIERSDSVLHNLAGFQDLRIIVSPAATGPSQALVETTWSNREGLATYEETRQTLLDLIAANADDVVPGSVQVFDMEVVRDTKDFGFRFGLGAAAAVLGSLAIGGFMIGAGVTVFHKDNKGAAAVSDGGGTGPAPATGLKVIATDNKFDKAALEAPANTDITVDFQNNGKVKHNLHFYDKEGGKTLATGAGSDSVFVDGGKSETLSFKTPGPDTYYFQCDLHPTEMKGTFTVKVVAAASAPAAAGTTAEATVIATDNKFDKTTLDAAAGKPFTVTFKNNGKVKHNLHFYDKKDGKTLAEGAGSDSTFVDGGKSETLTFTPPSGTKFYYQCDLHPTEMSGTLNVK